MTPQEQIRHSILENLYPTRKIRVPAIRIRRDAGRDTGATDESIDTEIEFLTDSGLVDAETDKIGSTKYYKLTPAGILASERL